MTGNPREESAVAKQPPYRITIGLASAAVIADGGLKIRLLGTRGRRREDEIEERNCWMIDEALIDLNGVSISRQHPHQQNAAHLGARLRHVARKASAIGIVALVEKIEWEKDPDTNGVHEKNPRYHQEGVRLNARTIEVDTIEIPNIRTLAAILLALSTTSRPAHRITKTLIVRHIALAHALVHLVLNVGGNHLQTIADQGDTTHPLTKVTDGNLLNQIVVNTTEILGRRLVLHQEI